MNKRVFIISLLLVLCLVTFAPSAVIAKNGQQSGGHDDFAAGGMITGIEDTNIGVNAFPCGNSGRWRVDDRDIYGVLEGDVNGAFILTYDANVDITTQAGTLHGTMTAGDTSFKVNGKIQPLELVPTPLGFDLPKLTITGHWNIEGAPGRGTFEAWLIFIPDEYGHVVQIIASAFTMTGSW
ncbi:MAG: hypothetical protein MUO19_02295 [Dehalococcoidales bacterium]|nr:hypothetical protein [Dehalococcoidales bacterium]